MLERIALGTVQFGVPYGVANTAGQVTLQEASAIVGAARDAGIDTLDTAIAYGESETRLGQIGVGNWRIVTKLPPVPRDTADAASWVRTSVQASLTRLRVARVHAVLLHRARDLADSRGDEILGALRALREAGDIGKLGVSIYEPEELDALPAHVAIDIVQAPVNVLDRRFQDSGWLDRLLGQNVEIHGRSIFLQGLLLMEQGARPQAFARWDSTWTAWRDWLREQGITPLRGCLGHALAQPGFQRLVIGVDSRAQLHEVLRAATAPALEVPPGLTNHDPALINPARWSTH